MSSAMTKQTNIKNKLKKRTKMENSKINYISEETKKNVCKAIIDTTEKMLKSSPLLIRKKPNKC